MDHNQRKKYLLKNTAIFALSNIGTKLIAFFLVPIYTAVLSTKEYGTVDLFFTIGTVIIPLLSLNIGESIMRFSLDKGADHERIMSTGLAALTLLLIIGLLIFPIANTINQIAPYATYLYFYTVSLGISQVFMCYLRGKEKLLQYSIGNIIQTFSVAVLNILFLVFLKQGIQGYFSAYILANTLTAVFAFFAGKVYEIFMSYKIDKELTKKMLLYSIILIPNTLLWYIMDASDRLMVSAMIGVSANGIYAVSYKLPSLLTVVTGIFTQAWSYSAIKEKDSKDIQKYNKIVYDKLVAVVLIMAVGLTTIIKPFLSVYVESSYYEAWKYTPFLIVGFVFNTLATFVATSYTVHKDSKGYLFSATVGASVNIILNWILIPFIGVYGAALATCISYFSVYLYRVFNTKKYLKLKVVNKKNCVGMLLLIISCITMFIELYYGLILQIAILLIVIFIYKSVFYGAIIVIKNKLKSIRENL